MPFIKRVLLRVLIVAAGVVSLDRVGGPKTSVNSVEEGRCNCVCIDLMALPSNVRLDRSGRPLKFFSPFPCVQAQGTNIFSQVLSSSKNAFVFPPFTLIGQLLKYLASQPCPFTMIAPDVSPRKYWWPLLQRQATVAFKLGQKGDNSILLFPTKTGLSTWEFRPL